MEISNLTKKRKIIIVLLLIIVLSFSYYLYDQGYVLSTKSIAEKIAENNWVPEGGDGIAGMEPRQFELFEILQRKASNQELLNFVSSENAALKCYAFWALNNRKDSNVYNLLIKNLYDTASVLAQRGCIMRHTNVREFFIEISFAQLSIKQISDLDSIMFYNNYGLFSYHELIETLEPKPEYYNSIKKEIIEKRNWKTLNALARYKNENDIEFIKSAFQNDTGRIYLLSTISEFPDNSFFPIMEETYKHIESDSLISYCGQDYYEFYNALVKYKTPESLNMIRESINKKSDKFDNLKKAIWLAIKKNPDNIYNDLLKEINLSKEDYEYLEQFL